MTTANPIPTTANPNLKTRQPRVLSSSSIHGTDVVNREGKSIGEIKDLMLDLRTGEVQYCVLSFGGFLGIGDKLFAVPLPAFDVDTHDEQFVLDVSKERLEQAPGFDKDNWPRTGDTAFVDSVYSYYGVQRRTLKADPRLS